MLKYYITPIFLFITILALNATGIFYQDRVLFYVDNHVFSYLKKFVKKNDIKSMIQQIRKIDKN